MAWPFCGNINGTVQSTSQNLPMELTSFTLVNKSGSNINVNVYKINTSGAQICIMPFGQQIAPSQMYQGDNPVVFLATEVVKIQTTGSCDYDLRFDNIVLNDFNV